MSLGLRIRLSIMMFLQYYVWGIWLPILSIHLGPNGLNLSAPQIGWIFTVYGFGASWNAMLTFAPGSATMSTAMTYRRVLPDVVAELRKRVDLI